MIRRLMWLGLLAGCATAPLPRAGATVVRVTREVQLSLEGAPPHPGDHGTLTRRVCKPLTPKTTAMTCVEQEVDAAEVVRVLDDGRAVVRLAGDADVRAGDRWLAATP